VDSILTRIREAGFITTFVHAANLGVPIYAAMRSIFASQGHSKPPATNGLLLLASLPLFLSAALSLMYLFPLPTLEQLFSEPWDLAPAEVPTGTTGDPHGYWGFRIVINAADMVRLSLYSGLLFSSLTLVIVYATRKFRSA
jgi:hypothetical protein